MPTIQILHGDALAVLRSLPAGSVHCCVTSPPYWGLRDYGVEGQLGLERTPEEYIERLVEIFREVRRVLRDDAVLWLNLGDSYNSNTHWSGGGPNATCGNTRKFNADNGRKIASDLKPKDLIGIPWRVALALQADGWWLRMDNVWSKPNPMPESVTDRPTKAHEYVFLLSKNERYFYDAEAIKEPQAESSLTRTDERRIGPKMNGGGSGNIKIGAEYQKRQRILPNGRNRRSVWTIATKPFNDWDEIVRRARVAPDEIDDDTMHITSPDCPIHGGHPAQAAKNPCGGHEADAANHTEHTDDRHDQVPPIDYEPIETIHGGDFVRYSLDYPSPGYALSAIGRSNENHKTDHDPGSNASCMPCEETVDGIGGKQVEPSMTERRPDMPENKTAEGDSGDNPSNQTVDRIVGTEYELASCEASTLTPLNTCTCLFYKEITQKSSHFATFPPELPEICIKAGTSEKGCCPKCGAGWERVIQRIGDSANGGQGSYAIEMARIGASNKSRASGFHGQVESNTLGWRPTCSCYPRASEWREIPDRKKGETEEAYIERIAPIQTIQRELVAFWEPAQAQNVPAVVLDPFSGAGTTGMVAARLLRDAILNDINSRYCDMAVRRIRRDGGMFVTIAERRPEE